MRKLYDAMCHRLLVQEPLQTVCLRLSDRRGACDDENRCSIGQCSGNSRKTVSKAAVGRDEGDSQFLSDMRVCLSGLDSGDFVTGVDQTDPIFLAAHQEGIEMAPVNPKCHLHSTSLSAATEIEPFNQDLPAHRDDQESDESSSESRNQIDLLLDAEAVNLDLNGLLPLNEPSDHAQDFVTPGQGGTASHLLGPVIGETQPQSQRQYHPTSPNMTNSADLLLNCLETIPLQKMMGAEQYEKITALQTPARPEDPPFRHTNSVFSDHISSWEQCLTDKWSSTAPLMNGKMDWYRFSFPSNLNADTDSQKIVFSRLRTL